MMRPQWRNISITLSFTLHLCKLDDGCMFRGHLQARSVCSNVGPLLEIKKQFPWLLDVISKQWYGRCEWRKLTEICFFLPPYISLGLRSRVEWKRSSLPNLSGKWMNATRLHLTWNGIWKSVVRNFAQVWKTCLSNQVKVLIGLFFC